MTIEQHKELLKRVSAIQSYLKIEDKIQILLNQKKSKTISDEEFNIEMKKLID